MSIADTVLPTAYLTNNVMIQPTTLGKDDGGGYYFQLAEINALNN